MSKFLVSIINYFFLLLFRRGVACDFPCFSSPFFVIKKTKKIAKNILGRKGVKISQKIMRKND